MGYLEIQSFYSPKLRIAVKRKQRQHAEEVYSFLKNLADTNEPSIKILEEDPSLTTFECYIHEERQNALGSKKTDTQKAAVQLEDDKIIVSKSGMFTNMDKGTKTVLFQDVSSINLDLGRIYNHIILTMPGSPGVTLQQPIKSQAQKIL